MPWQDDFCCTALQAGSPLQSKSHFHPVKRIMRHKIISSHTLPWMAQFQSFSASWSNFGGTLEYCVVAPDFRVPPECLHSYCTVPDAASNHFNLSPFSSLKAVMAVQNLMFSPEYVLQHTLNCLKALNILLQGRKMDLTTGTFSKCWQNNKFL